VAQAHPKESAMSPKESLRGHSAGEGPMTRFVGLPHGVNWPRMAIDAICLTLESPECLWIARYPGQRERIPIRVLESGGVPVVNQMRPCIVM